MHCDLKIRWVRETEEVYLLARETVRSLRYTLTNITIVMTISIDNSNNDV